jgi:PAS domain S-box-containing protein
MEVDTSEDPTEPQPMEEPLHCRPPELVDFLERAPVGLHWVGPDGSILWANQTELELLGYPREEYIGHHIAEFHADADVLADILQRLTHHETVHDYEARLRCKDGAIKHVLIDANVRWEDGRFIHTRCVTRDITAHRQIAQHVATQHAVTRSLAESATLAAATPSMLQAICEGLGWEMGVVWCIDPHANVLRCLDL